MTIVPHQSPPDPSISLGTCDIYRVWRKWLISKRASWLTGRSCLLPGSWPGLLIDPATVFQELQFLPLFIHPLLAVAHFSGDKTVYTWNRGGHFPGVCFALPWPCITGALGYLGNSA